MIRTDKNILNDALAFEGQKKLVPLYGNSYSKRNLDYYRRFYLMFSDLEIVNARVHNLTWTHLRIIMRATLPEAYEWYMNNSSLLNGLYAYRRRIAS